MASIRSQDTRPERVLRSGLHRRGYRFRKHAKDLAGRPDIVFRAIRVAVFVEGDFWHGYQFAKWSSKLSPYWVAKISRNIQRDKKTRRALRRADWKVLRVWEHEVRKSERQAIARVVDFIESRRRELRSLRKSS